MLSISMLQMTFPSKNGLRENGLALLTVIWKRSGYFWSQSEHIWNFFEAWWASPNKFGLFWGLMGQSEQICGILRPDGQSEQNLTFWANACCSPNILGEIFEFLSVHLSRIFRNFHLALPPIFRGPMVPFTYCRLHNFVNTEILFNVSPDLIPTAKQKR